MNKPLPTLREAKDLARRLRTKLAEEGAPVGHAKALELVAHQHGFRDWNTMSAAIGSVSPVPWNVGDRVSGTYLSQDFTAQVIAVSVTQPGWFRLDLQLEKAVDVVTSEGFSNLRSRIHGVIGPKGHSREKTRDGKPHLQIEL